MSQAAALLLACGESQVRLRPALGGAVEAFSWRGIEVLRPAQPDGAVRQMGIFPLIPYANRIGNGQLPGHAALRANFPGEAHSLHGFGWQRAWHVLEQDARTARLGLQHAPDADWPFACGCAMQVELSEKTLRLELSVINHDAAPMPAGLGFHPYFPIDAATRLSAQLDGRFETGPDNLPQRHRRLPAAIHLAVDSWQVDHCYSGWNGQAVLDYATHRTVLEADRRCTYLHCFQPGDGRPFVALEPVSHVPNAHQKSAARQQAYGLRQLAQGDTFSISMTITVCARPA